MSTGDIMKTPTKIKYRGRVYKQAKPMGMIRVEVQYTAVFDMADPNPNTTDFKGSKAVADEFVKYVTYLNRRGELAKRLKTYMLFRH
jgi:hypothetical protein